MSAYVPHIFYECPICAILGMVEIVGGWFEGVTPKEKLYQPLNLENFGVFYIFCAFSESHAPFLPQGNVCMSSESCFFNGFWDRLSW